MKIHVHIYNLYKIHTVYFTYLGLDVLSTHPAQTTVTYFKVPEGKN